MKEKQRVHKHADILAKYWSFSNLLENFALSEGYKYTSKTGNISNIKLKRFALLLQVSNRFEIVNCYQVLHNVTYVATHLFLMNLYRT